MNIISEFTKGIIKENPSLVLLLGLCPTLAVTTGIENAIGMGLASTFVLVCSNAILSIIRNFIPNEIRIPIFITIIATFVTVVKFIMYAYVPAIAESLGIFLPLIAVNCIVFARAEAFASKNKPLPSIFDGLGMGIGFTLSLMLIAIIREFFGSGKFFGIPIAEGIESYTLTIFVLAPGGFLTVGLLLAMIKQFSINMRKKEELKKAFENTTTSEA